MKYIYTQNNKIFIGIIGAALIILGALCICNPWGLLQSIAWIIGILIMISGCSTLVFWLTSRAVNPASSPVFLTAIIQILLGLALLNSKFLSAMLIVALGIGIIVVGVLILLALFAPMIIRKRYQNNPWNQDDSIDEQ